jgi:hypothetical protein
MPPYFVTPRARAGRGSGGDFIEDAGVARFLGDASKVFLNDG